MTGAGSAFCAFETSSTSNSSPGKLPAGMGRPSRNVAARPSTCSSPGPPVRVSGKLKRPFRSVVALNWKPLTFRVQGAPPTARRALSSTSPTKLVGCRGSRSRAWAVKAAGRPTWEGIVASTRPDPARGPRVHSTSACPVRSVTATAELSPSTRPPPFTTSKVTGTPAAPFWPSETQTRSGSPRGASVSPFWPWPSLTWMREGGAAVAEAQKKIEPEMSLLVAVARLLPQPASLPRNQKAWATPAASVLTCRVPLPGALPSADRSPLLFVTWKVTTLPAKGEPSALSTCTAIGWGRSVPTTPLWAPPPATTMVGPLAATFWTVIWADFALPRKSVATAVITVGRLGSRGSAGRKKVPLVPMPTSTAAGRPFTSTASPWKPESRSLTRPATSTVAVVIWAPAGGKSMNTLGGCRSWVTSATTAALGVPPGARAVKNSLFSWFVPSPTWTVKASATTGATAKPAGPTTSTWAAPVAVPVKVRELAAVSVGWGSTTGGAGAGSIEPGGGSCLPPKERRRPSVNASPPGPPGSMKNACTSTVWAQ